MLGDTIVAIATPRGEGALSIVRVSGPDAIGIADVCFRGRRAPSKMASHKVAYGRIVAADGDRVLDHVLLTVMRGPRTSTGEDTVEISCHGGRLPAALVLDRVLEAGARPAEPGEFTRRAFLNGRIDLVQAEGVFEITRARTAEGLEAAVRQVGGESSRRFEALRENLDECRAQLECAIDFAEEAAPWTDEEICARMIEACSALKEMLARARIGRRLQDGVVAAIVGRPNVGKSTLFNRLLGVDRAIVSDEPGTTRDFVAEEISIRGVPVRLVDTAGVRPSAGRIESCAVERARQQESGADQVLLMIDGHEAPSSKERDALARCDRGRTVVVLNKMDLGVCPEVEAMVRETAPGVRAVCVSALRGRGVEDLRDVVARAISHGGEPQEGVPASVRQMDILRRTADALERSIEAMTAGNGIELAACDLREAVETFGEIAGTTSAEEILDRVFSRFCIGK